MLSVDGCLYCSTSLGDMEYLNFYKWFKCHIDPNVFSTCMPSTNAIGHITDLGLDA